MARTGRESPGTPADRNNVPYLFSVRNMFFLMLPGAGPFPSREMVSGPFTILGVVPFPPCAVAFGASDFPLATAIRAIIFFINPPGPVSPCTVTMTAGHASVSATAFAVIVIHDVSPRKAASVGGLIHGFDSASSLQASLAAASSNASSLGDMPCALRYSASPGGGRSFVGPASL
jgi:hypothetical protein